MTWGVVPEGFNRKTQPDVKADLDSALISKFGPATNVGTSSVFGRIVGIISSALAALWQSAEDVYNAFSPDTASGVALDNCVALTGISRKGATPSQAWGILRLTAPGIVGWGSRVAVANTAPVVEFTLDLDVPTPLATACFGAWIEVTAAAGDAYHVVVNGVDHHYHAVPGDTAATILWVLANLVEIGAVKDLVRCQVLVAEPSLEILAEANGQEVPATLSVVVSVVGGFGGTIAISQTGGVGYFTASQDGPQEAPARTLTDILDPDPNWTSVVNPAPATPGSLIETDAELRLRRAQSIHVANGGTVEAIRTRLLELDEVNQATVLENITDVIDLLGVPPHAIYAIIDCPVDPAINAEVGEVLWATKPAGIATHGTVAVTVLDSQSFEHIMYFSRPTAVRVYVKVDYHKYDEETFPTTGEQGIREAVVAYAAIYEIGIDVLPHRFYGPIFAAVPGIASLVVSARLDPGDPWLTTPIPIAWDERAEVDIGDVLVVLVP